MTAKRSKCYITTVSRIHITLIDLSLKGTRIDGGAGISLDKPRHVIEIMVLDRFKSGKYVIGSRDLCIKVNRSLDSIIFKCIENTLKHIDADNKCVEINIVETYDSHIGLGSTTQMCIGISMGISKAFKHDIEPEDSARICSRAGTSGIGLYAFKYGGFIVDGGHRLGSGKIKPMPSDSVKEVDIPPIIARVSIPDHWRFILIRPKISKRIFGKLEEDVFTKYTPISFEDTVKVSYHVLMGLLPSVASDDIEEFKYHVKSIQRLGFKKVEWEIQDSLVIKTKDILDKYNISYGLSSMGPTIYIPETVERLDKTMSILKNILDKDLYIIQVSKGINRGAEIKCVEK